ncbi:MAG: 50S ribosomal protein L10 [Acidimicrobiia bacterium]|nr:50S ribosomal protein L10 [Acidimicrobiia bacterium]
MPRPEKVQAVADIRERLEKAQAVFLAEYAGLSVNEQQEMRRALRATDGQFKVVKMTLARLAAEELGHTDLAELLVGPTGLAFADHDAAATAKALRDFAKDHAMLTIKGALLSGEVLSPEKVSELADLPSRDVLLSQIAGAFEAPMAMMAGLLGALPRDLASMVLQLIDKMSDGAPADEPEPATEETAAEEAVVEDAAVPAEEAAAEEPEAAPAEEAAAETTEEPEEAPAEEAAAETTEEPEEAPAEKAVAEEAPEAAAEIDDENDKADEAEEE